MASVWQDLNAFVRNGGQSESVISRAQHAARQGARGCWQAEDHVMGMDEWVQGFVLERVADRDGFMWVQWRARLGNVHSLLRIASALPVLVVDMKDERQRQRLAQLHADTSMDLVWTKLVVHCTSNVVPQLHNLLHMRMTSALRGTVYNQL